MKGGMDNPPKRDLRKVEEDTRGAVSGVMSIEDEGNEDTGGGQGSNRLGRQRRTHGKSGPKSPDAEGVTGEPASSFDAEKVTQAWDTYREVQELEQILVTRANAINNDVEDAYSAEGFDKKAIREEILRFDDVRDNQTRPSLGEVGEASRKFTNTPSPENALAYAQAVENFAAKVQLMEASGKEFIAAVERAPQIDSPQEFGTVREERTRLRNAVEEMRVLEQAKAYAEGRETEYFAALKERFKNQSGIETLANQVVDTSNRGSKELKQLRSLWVQSRAEFAGAQRASAEARLKADPSAARARLLERLKQKHGEGSEKADILQRYERIVTAGSVVVGLEEAEQRVKEEGLSERDKGTLDAALEWYKDLPPGVRVFGTSALMFGAGAAIAGTPAGWVALGLGGGAALARWGAEVQKGPKTKKAFGYLSRIASVGGVVGFATEFAVRSTHDVLGTEKKAEEVLETREGLGDLSDPKNLERISKKRRKATVVEESINRQGRLARMVGSLTGGWLFGNAMGGDDNAVETTAAKVDAPEATSEEAGESAAETTTRAPAATETAQPVQPAAPVENAPPSAAPEAAPPVEPIVATIEAGEGFNKLFLDLRESVDTRLHGMQDTSSSPVMKYLFETSPTELSDRIGAFDPKTGESMIMQVGDKLYLDDKGDLYFERQGEEAQLVMKNDPSAPEGFKVEELKDAPMQAAPQAPSVRVEERVQSVETNEETEPLRVQTGEAEPATMAASATNEGGPLPESTPQPESFELPREAGTRTIEDSLREIEGAGERVPQSQTPLFESSSESSARTIEDSIREAGEQPHTNIHNVEVTPNEVAPYQWKVPGTNETYTVVYGGSPEETQAWITRELELRPTARILVNESYINPDTGAAAMRVNGWHVDQEGKVAVEEGIKNSATGLALPPIAEDALIRKLS